MTPLVLTSLVGRMPIGMLSLAMVLFVQRQTGSFAVAGAVTAAGALSAALGAPALGRLVDRRGQTTVLLGALAVWSAGVLAFVAAGRAGASAGLLAGLAAVGGFFFPPISPCLRGLWPSVLPDRDAVRTALALDALVIEGVFIGGPLLVALAVAVASPAVALLGAVGLAVAGTVAFAALPPSRDWTGEARRGGRAAGPLRSPGLRTLLSTALTVGVLFGALEVAFAAFGTQEGARSAAGLALAALGAGSAVGGIVYGARAGGREVRGLYLVLVCCVPLAAALLVLAGSVAALVALAPLAGLAIAPLTAVENELVGDVAPAGTVTEAYAWMLTALVAGVAAGNAAAGVVVEAAGWRTAVLGACAVTAVGAVTALARRHTLVPVSADHHAGTA